MNAPIRLTVNGRAHAIEAAPTTPLLDVLRGELGLRGSRFGCGLEQCGACKVLIDGVAEYSCSREVGTLDGRSIMTVESLGTVDKPHPIQQAFIDEQAGQCGYCLSGILIATRALLDRNPAPTREDVVAALDPHLCRCGTHARIIRAVLRAATVLRGESVR